MLSWSLDKATPFSSLVDNYESICAIVAVMCARTFAKPHQASVALIVLCFPAAEGRLMPRLVAIMVSGKRLCSAFASPDLLRTIDIVKQ